MDVFVPEGWTKSWRRLEYSPIYRNHAATRVFEWMIWHAEPEPKRIILPCGPIVVQRGQLYVDYGEMAARTYCSRKQVIGACATLRKFEAIDWVKAGKGLLFTVKNYGLYQAKRAPALPPVETSGEDDENTPGNGHDDGQDGGFDAGGDDGHDAGTIADDATPSGDKEIADAEEQRRARSGHDCGQDEGVETRVETGHAINKDKEVKKGRSLNPPTPFFSKGGTASSNSDSDAILGTREQCAGMVLKVWRDEWDRVGKPRPEGGESKRDKRGALALTDDWLKASKMNVDGLRKGMRGIIHSILNEKGCSRLDLLTLSKDPIKYGAEPIVATQKRSRIQFQYVCNVCGATQYGDWIEPPPEKPPPQVCMFNFARGCQGMMEIVSYQKR